MATEEFNSFVRKFFDLWKSGLHASLHLETTAGKATVSLSLELGTVVSAEEAKPHYHKKVSPSQVRRRQRRAQARREANGGECNVIVKSASEEDATFYVASVEDNDREEMSVEDVSSQEGMKEGAFDDMQVELNDTEEVDKVDDDDIGTLEEISQSTSKIKAADMDKDDDLSLQLENLIKQSEKNRNLWEKSQSLPS